MRKRVAIVQQNQAKKRNKNKNMMSYDMPSSISPSPRAGASIRF